MPQVAYFISSSKWQLIISAGVFGACVNKLSACHLWNGLVHVFTHLLTHWPWQTVTRTGELRCAKRGGVCLFPLTTSPVLSTCLVGLSPKATEREEVEQGWLDYSAL